METPLTQADDERGDDSRMSPSEFEDHTQPDELARQTIFMESNSLMPARMLICNQSEALQAEDICNNKSKTELIVPGHNINYTGETSKKCKHDDADKDVTVSTFYLSDHEEVILPSKQPVLIKLNSPIPARPSVCNGSEVSLTAGTRSCSTKWEMKSVGPRYDAYGNDYSKMVSNSISPKSGQFTDSLESFTEEGYQDQLKIPVLTESNSLIPNRPPICKQSKSLLTKRTRPCIIVIKKEPVDSAYEINADDSTTIKPNTVAQKQCVLENAMKIPSTTHFTNVTDSSVSGDTSTKPNGNNFYPSMYGNSELLETEDITRTRSTEIRTGSDGHECCVYVGEFSETESNSVVQKQCELENTSEPENTIDKQTTSQLTNIIDSSSKENIFLSLNDNKKYYLSICAISDSMGAEDVFRTCGSSIEMDVVDPVYAAEHSKAESNAVAQNISENAMQSQSKTLVTNMIETSFMEKTLSKRNDNGDVFLRVHENSESLKADDIVKICDTEIGTELAFDSEHSVCVEEISKSNSIAQKCESENLIKDQSSSQFMEVTDSCDKNTFYKSNDNNESYSSISGISEPLKSKKVIIAGDINIKVECDDHEYKVEHYAVEISKPKSNSVPENQHEVENAMKDQSNNKLTNDTYPTIADNKLLVPSKPMPSIVNVEEEQISNNIHKLLSLNIYFEHEDVEECMKHITWKYIYDSKFQKDNLEKFSQFKRDDIRAVPSVKNFKSSVVAHQNSTVTHATPLPQVLPLSQFKKDNIYTVPLIQNSKPSVTTHNNSTVAQVTPSSMHSEETKNNQQNAGLLSEGKKRKSQELSESSAFPKKIKSENLNKEKCSNVNDEYKNQGFKITAKKPPNSPSPTTSSNSLSRSTNSRNLRITTEEYLQRNKILRDPRLRKKLASDVKLTTDILRDDSRITRELHSSIPNVRPSVSIENDSPVDFDNFSELSYSRMTGPVSSYINKMRDRGEKSYNIEAQDLPFLIIEWNTSWLTIQKEREEFPPILGDFEIYETKTIYNDSNYSLTYCGLHLLNIWLNIYRSWRNNSKMFECHLISCEKRGPHFKYTCHAVLHFDEIPTQQSIILIMFTKSRRQVQYFGYVYDVKTRPFVPPPRKYRRSDRPKEMKKVKFSFYTVEKVGDSKENIITVQPLYRTRVAIKQFAALDVSKYSELKKVVLNPVSNAHKIRAVHLPSDYSDSSYSSEILQKRIDKIIETAVSQNNLFTLVQKPQGRETSTVIIKLIRYLMKGSTILICLQDVEKFRILANTLKDIKSTVLAVKESEVSIPEDLEAYTLRAHASKLSMDLEKAELEILKNSKFILTVTSNVFLSDTKTAVLGSNLICIVDDAHMTTEAETALLFSYKPKAVVLLGDVTEHAALHASLQRLGYHKTLFHRLFRFAQGRYAH